MQPEKNIFGKTSYRDFYRKSDIRTNLLNWIKLPRGGRILVVNEEKTCLVKLLKQQGNRVTCIQDTEIGEKADGWYDVILQMGALHCGASKPQEVYEKYFGIYKEHLTERGRLFLAVENRLGLKYFAGCMDEGTDTYFAGIEGYPKLAEGQSAALSKREYTRALKNAGFETIEQYYPYPDIRFPMAIYSDEWLPGEGELNANIRNFDRDRYVVFDETRVFDSLIKEGLFGEFSNSFFFVCSKVELEQKNKILYVKFSNEREPRFQIRTEIIRAEDGKKYVVKHPLNRKAKGHIQNMRHNYECLSNANRDETIHFCPVETDGDDAVFPFVKGISLQTLLLKTIEARQEEKTKELLIYAAEKIKRYYALQNREAEKVTDLDMIFPNILIDGENWNIIDYEWTFPGEIPPEFALYRALFRAAVELPECGLTDLGFLCEICGITAGEAEKYRAWEMQFQNYITGEQVPARDMVEMLGNRVIPFFSNLSESERRVQEFIRSIEVQALNIYYNIDNRQIYHGKMSCSGWACAITGKKQFLPVNIRIFEENGEEIACKIERTIRKDVASTLEADENQWMIWGFHAMFTAREGDTYRIQFNAGNIQKETTFTGVNE